MLLVEQLNFYMEAVSFSPRLIRLAVLEGLCVQKEIEECPGSQPYVCIVKRTKEVSVVSTVFLG